MPPLDKARVQYAAAVRSLAEGLLGESAGPTIGDGCPQGDPDCYAGFTGDHQLCQYRPPGTTPAAAPRTAANIGHTFPGAWPLPGEWQLRLLGYLDAGHIWLGPAGWSVTADAPQHTDSRAQLFAEHRPTANAVDAQLRTWLDNGIVVLQRWRYARDAHGERRLRLTPTGRQLLAEMRVRYGR